MKQGTAPAPPRSDTKRSTLKALREMQPNRQLSWTESQAVAARQASLLRTLHDGWNEPAFDESVIMNLPRLRVELDPVINAAGSSHWTGTHWQILIQEDDHPVRQRFTLAHEYKHIIDYGGQISPEIEERVCDHFAACLLMPKRLVISAWTSGEIGRTVAEMAGAFGVSQKAMRYRLQDLGLLDRAARCGYRASSITRTALTHAQGR